MSDKQEYDGYGVHIEYIDQNTHIVTSSRRIINYADDTGAKSLLDQPHEVIPMILIDGQWLKVSDYEASLIPKQPTDGVTGEEGNGV